MVNMRNSLIHAYQRHSAVINNWLHNVKLLTSYSLVVVRRDDLASLYHNMM
jgi:hypothetical protein